MNRKLDYLLEQIRKRLAGQAVRCPNCGAAESDLVQRKYLVTELRKCQRCKLLYRYPVDSAEDSGAFYQDSYDEGFTTSLPSDDELNGLLKEGFQGHEKDCAIYLEVIRALSVGSGNKIIDFGCSWGYGAWQLERAGYCVQGYEISRIRATYGRERLGLDIVGGIEALKSGADVFFSSHVLEHVPSIQQVVEVARKTTKPGGLFIAFTPNGSEAFRRRNPQSFKMLWGKVHPNFLTDEFYREIFSGTPLLLASPPYDYREIARWNCSSNKILGLGGNELLAVAVI